ncbi:MAG: right-handed parallel beta-helix repeat-containing protein [Spirochaetales bacterium]|nr:right-handed parallel beta-helix repeat-containing protein [Spirochaetales bacterium]
MQMNDSYEVDASGRKCYGSDSDKSIDLYLRNPQRYDINFDYKYNLSGLESVIAAPSVPFTIIQNPIDKTMATLTFKKEFLEKIDNGDFTVDGTIQKNISEDIRLTEKGTGRLFDSFHIDLSANTKPPRFRYSMFQRKGNIGDDDTCYVLCFNIPKIDGTIHERDTRNLYIGKDHWTFSGNITTDADLTADASNRYKLTTVQPTPLRLLDDTDDTSFLNPEPTALTSLYYIIDDKNPEDNTENIGYMLRIQDDEGLYNQVYVSIKALQLKEPLTVSENGSAVEDSNIVSADDNTGYYKLVLTHSKGTWQFDETYGKIDGQNLTAMPKICYTIYQNSIPFASGTQTAPVKINLPPSSTKYTVKAYAHENGYVDSDEIEVKDIKVTRSTNYYVSQNGSDLTGLGSPALPYRTIQKAVSDFENYVALGDFDVSSQCVIRVMSDLTPVASDKFDAPGNSFITFSKTNKYLIEGYGRKFTIDAKKKGRIIYSASSSNIELKNLILKGGFSSDQGAAICIKASDNGILTIDSCTVSENEGIGANCYGGIIFASKGKLSLTDSHLSNNKLDKTGVAARGMLVYTNNGYTLKNSFIENNEIKITGNNPSNVDIKGALFMYDGSYQSTISGSKILKNRIIGDGASRVTIYGLVYFADNNGASMRIEDSEISGNSTSLGSEGKLLGSVYAGKTNQTTISGSITIDNNSVYLQDDDTTTSNLYVDKNKPLKIAGKLKGKIGITSNGTPTISEPIKFTSGYGNFNPAQHPALIFHYDGNAAAISNHEGEAALAVSGGGISEGINENPKFTIDADAAVAGMDQVFTVSATVSGESIPEKDITYSYSLKLAGTRIGSSNYVADKNKITLKSTLTSGDYYIIVKALYKGYYYNAEFKVVITDAVEVANESELTAALAKNYSAILLTQNIPLTTPLEVTRKVLIMGSSPSINLSNSSGFAINVNDANADLTIKNLTFGRGYGAIKVANGKATLGSGTTVSPNGTASTPIAVDGANATLYMKDGAKITGNKSQDGYSYSYPEGGGGVTIWNGTFYMEGGEIFDNAAISNGSAYGGGGVMIATYGKMVMSGGKIHDNNAKFGDGIYLYRYTSGTPTFEMTGGEIYSNGTSSTDGTGIRTNGSTSSITISGGKIHDHKTGILAKRGNILKISGGEIKNNTETDIHLDTDYSSGFTLDTTGADDGIIGKLTTVSNMYTQYTRLKGNPAAVIDDQTTGILNWIQN